MTNDPLLQPFQLKHLKLRNRILSTAHEPSYTDDGLPKERYRLYHSEKAKGGIALTMIGGSAVVAPDSPQAFGNILLYKDECVRWLRELADDVHDHGAAVMIQITHLGRRTSWAKADWLPVLAPSNIREPVHRSFPKIMEDWDIARVIKAYADSAERVKAAGLDGLEVFCAGHLIDQFWSPATNKRTDEYGGSLDNRMLFGMQVLSAVRERVGKDFIVGVRMVCDEDWGPGLSENEGLDIVKRTAASDLVDFVNVNRGHIDSEEGMSRVMPGMGAPSAPFLDLAGKVRALTQLPTFQATRIQDVATARYAIESGKLDMVGMTRPHMADPHIVRKIVERREHEIRPCVGANYCIDSIYGGTAFCIHNAATGRELWIPHVVSKAEGPVKNVVVVGAGPGGLEAARIAAERGHKVTVFEAAPEAGGQVRLTASLLRRREIIGIVDWRLQECERLGVQFHFNHYAEASDVTSLEPDYVVVATGGLPNTSFLDEGEELVTTSWDILSGAAKPGTNVILFDDHGAHPGMTTAEFVAEAGSKLEIVTPERSIAPDLGPMNFPPYQKVLNEKGATISLNLRLEKVERRDNRLVATFLDEFARRRIEKEADQIIVEHGSTPLDDLYFELKPGSLNLGETDQDALINYTRQNIVRNPGGRYHLFRVGDAVASRNVHAAVLDAARMMKDI